MSFLIVKINGISQQVFCENRFCSYDKTEIAYSWEHANKLGWNFISSDKMDKKKASPFNPGLFSVAKNDVKNLESVEAYCPVCSKKIS